MRKLRVRANLVARLLVTLAFVVFAPSALRAQEVDTARLARMISDFRPEMAFVESARAFVVARARGGDSVVVRETIRLLDGRAGDALASGSRPWLSPFERLALFVALPAGDVVGDSVAIGRLLSQESGWSESDDHGDDLAEELRELVRTGAQRIAARFDDGAPSEEERRFLNILINHVYLRGLRGRSELSSRAERFASDYPASWRSRLLERTIIGDYREDRLGLAFAAGYRTADVLGDAGDRLEYAHGATLAAEAYYDQLTVIFELDVGVANAPEPFVANGVTWSAGDLPYLSGSIVAGYELRWNRVALTPLAGVALHSLRVEERAGESGPRSGFRGGFDAGAMISYRIPFDVGTHIDLRMRAGATTMAMSGYDAGLNGTMLYVQAGFALVYRPYRPRGG